MKILKMLRRNSKPQDVQDNGDEAIIKSGIAVLGSGCSRCRTLYENTRKAAARVRPGEEVGYCTDPAEAARCGVMSMPALVDGGRILSMGKVLSEDEIATLLGGCRQDCK